MDKAISTTKLEHQRARWGILVIYWGFRTTDVDRSWQRMSHWWWKNKPNEVLGKNVDISYTVIHIQSHLAEAVKISMSFTSPNCEDIRPWSLIQVPNMPFEVHIDPFRFKTWQTGREAPIRAKMLQKLVGVRLHTSCGICTAIKYPGLDVLHRSLCSIWQDGAPNLFAGNVATLDLALVVDGTSPLKICIGRKAIRSYFRPAGQKW
jgi:hypothetical protein